MKPVSTSTASIRRYCAIKPKWVEDDDLFMAPEGTLFAAVVAVVLYLVRGPLLGADRIIHKATASTTTHARAWEPRCPLLTTHTLFIRLILVRSERFAASL